MIKKIMDTFTSKSIAERLLIISIVATVTHLVVGLIDIIYTLLFYNALAGIGAIFFYLLPTLFWLLVLYLLNQFKNKDNIIFIAICSVLCLISVLFSIVYIAGVLWFF